MRNPILLALLLVLAPNGGAQEASSESFQLLDLVIDSGGGGECSMDYALWASSDGVNSSTLASSNYELVIGFAGTVDSEPGNTPVVFGLNPFFGPQAGGTPLVISGLNFDKFGVGASVTVDIGGVPATDVMVVSDTQITCTSPALSQGPHLLEVTSSYGTGVISDAYVSTPAVTSTQVASVGGQIEVTNYGPPGALFNLYWSFNSTSIPLPPYGTLLIGPAPIILGPGIQVYPGPDGISSLSFTAPPDPAFSGITMYWQSVVILSLDPLDALFTNSPSTQLP